ncbi:MAG: shikimate dehydrogenase [Rhabdochlamydiaceae bacterium]|jgi:3-dehydroquinate dehydratase/shikimate dehydrogenase
MSTLLFGVIPGPDIKSAENLLSKGRSHIDGIELRLDHFDKIDLEGLKGFLKGCGLPVMFTVRRNDQGGAFLGTEKERLELLESLCALEPDYLDLEYDVPIDFRKKLFEAFPKVSFLSSYHDFTHTPADLEAILNKMKTPYAHIYKMAFTAKSSVDALRLLTFVLSHEKMIVVSMEEEGRATRILAPVVGCVLTYATFVDGSSTAPGQISARQLQEIYRFRKLNRQTEVYGVIGDPIYNSLGHLIHNAVFDDANKNAVYFRIRLKAEELSSFIPQILKLPFKGLSVTMPLKEAIMPFLGQTSIDTRVIGASNSIQIKEGVVVGYNTDGIGALNAIERRGLVYGRHLVFVGAGGAAKALIFEAARRGAYVTVINRTPDRAIEIANIVKGRGGGFDLFPEVCKQGYDIIINCTPVSDLVDEKWILPEKIAMDIVYVPKNTPFLVKASQKKCRIVYGYEMFVAQSLEQERIWFPEGIDFEKAYAIIEEKVISALA